MMVDIRDSVLGNEKRTDELYQREELWPMQPVQTATVFWNLSLRKNIKVTFEKLQRILFP